MKDSFTRHAGAWRRAVLGGAALAAWMALTAGCGGGGGGGGGGDSGNNGAGPAFDRPVLYAKASDTATGDNFGTSVAVSANGNTMVTGAHAKGGSTGAAYVYVRDPASGAWSFQSTLTAANAGAADQFGISMAISDDGNTVVVGARGEKSNATGVDGNGADNSASNAGAAYVFTRTGSSWSQQAYLKASNTEAADLFGSAVAISGDGSTLAVGAMMEDSNGTQSDNSVTYSGAVYVFTLSAGHWSQQAYLKASTPIAQEHLGASLSLSRDGNRLAAGASEYYVADTGPGAAYLFTRSAGTWSAPVRLAAAHGETGDRFGLSVSLSADGTRLAVGALGEGAGSAADETNNDKPGSGAVYLFTQNGGGWSQEAFLKASNPDIGDNFGSAVSLSGDGAVLAVGAMREQSAATGVDGAQGDNSLSVVGAGAAYLFERTQSGWSQRHYVKATNPGDGDAFGGGLVLSADGKTLAVGASGEQSASAWTSRDPADNSAVSAGAVYVY